MPATTGRPTEDDALEGESEDRPTPDELLDRRLREYGVSVARRELATAFESLDDLSPAQRRTVALMAGRIAAGVLDPARRGVTADGTTAAETVRRLFEMDEHVRDRR